MSLVRLIARPMLATIFVVQGTKQLRNPEPLTPAAAAFAEQAGPTLQRLAPWLPSDPKTMVRLNAGVHVGAGLALATGRMPRLAALALAATLVPTTWAGHAYWRIDDPAERDAQRIQVMKNAGLAGGLLLASVDTEGKPGLSWRARRAARDARRAGKLAARDARRAGQTARREARHTVHRAKSGIAALPHRVS